MKVVLNFTKFHEISFQAVIFRTFSFILRQALIFRKYLIFRTKSYTLVILQISREPGFLILSPASWRRWGRWRSWRRGCVRGSSGKPLGTSRRRSAPTTTSWTWSDQRMRIRTSLLRRPRISKSKSCIACMSIRRRSERLGECSGNSGLHS